MARASDSFDRHLARWQRNYKWNLWQLSLPGALDPAYEGTTEELARAYADADTGEGLDRGETP